MFYYLFNYLQSSFGHFAGAGLWQYISFRAIMAGVIALLTSMWFGKYFIRLLRRKHISETQRDAKTDPFNTKKVGVPTMGGIVIIVAILTGALLMGKLGNVYMLLMLITTLLLGALGFADDYIKTFRKNKDGLNGWIKIAGQVALGLLVGLTLRYAPAAVMNETVEVRYVVGSTADAGDDNTYVAEQIVKSPDVKSTRTTIPFVKNHNANYADLFSWLGEPYMYRAGWILFVMMIIFVVAAVSNGANLNDGMDGMCAGNSAIIGVTLGILAYVSGHVQFASYLNVMYIPGTEEVLVFLCAFVGALVGFLWYNAYPAKVFMGDTGSLAIGGVIAVTAIIIHKELLLPIMCGIFLMESVSVMLQVAYAKKGNARGEKWRVFKRAPFHDHYRHRMEDGVKYLIKRPHGLLFESMITTRFWIVTILLAAITIITLKIR